MRAYIMHGGGLIPSEFWTGELMWKNDAAVVKKKHQAELYWLLHVAIRFVSLNWISLDSVECEDTFSQWAFGASERDHQL